MAVEKQSKLVSSGHSRTISLKLHSSCDCLLKICMKPNQCSRREAGGTQELCYGLNRNGSYRTPPKKDVWIFLERRNRRYLPAKVRVGKDGGIAT